MWSGADASYLAAITAAGRKYTWHGTLTDANGSTYNFDAEDIVKGSGQISKMVSSDTSLDIGTVYTSELTIRLYLAVNRYVLFGGTIDLYCDMDVNGATYSVPMGEYIIASCTQEMACISITAYDAMTKLDSVNVVQDLGASTPYAWITYFLSRAGLTLGTAQATIEAMPNGTELLTFTNCNTELAAMPCRDALAYMCMILCANAYVGRDGKVYIQQYSMTADDDIAANERFSSSFSDFTTNYTSVTLGIHATGTTEYYAQPTDDGLNYDLGANPWMQAGSAAARETMCRAILADLNAVSYEPYTVSIPIRPELDPMDVLTFSGNQASTDKGAVTSVVYKLGGAMTIKCSGENPRLAGAKSKTQKSLEALSSTVAKEINQMSVVQNSSAVTCGENTETSILTYNFEVTQAENTTMVDVSVVMTSSASETEANDVYTLSDIVAHLSFYVDGSEVSVYSPEFIVDEGKDTMTFNYSLSGLSVGAHQFDVRLTVNGGSGSIAAGDAHELLWGYGITFEVYVKGIAVTEPPTKTRFYVGESTDYSGIEVREVYNNGLSNDVTERAMFDPVAQTELTEDEIGYFPINISYGDYTTSFNITVMDLLYNMYMSSNTRNFYPYTVVMGRTENMGVYARRIGTNGTTPKQMYLGSSKIDVTSDYAVPKFDSFSAANYHALGNSNVVRNVFYATLGDLVYVIVNEYDTTHVPHSYLAHAFSYNMADGTIEDLTIQYNIESATYPFTMTGMVFASNIENVSVVDGVMAIRCQICDDSETKYPGYGYAYATIEQGVMTWNYVETSERLYALNKSYITNGLYSSSENSFDTFGVYYDGTSKSLVMRKYTFDPVNYLEWDDVASCHVYPEIASASSIQTVFTKISNQNACVVVVYDSAENPYRYYFCDADNETIEELFTATSAEYNSSGTGAWFMKSPGVIGVPDNVSCDSRLTWYSEIGMYVYILNKNRSVTERECELYCSETLSKGAWKKVQVQPTAYTLATYSQNMIEDNGRLIGTDLIGSQQGHYAFTLHGSIIE